MLYKIDDVKDMIKEIKYMLKEILSELWADVRRLIDDTTTPKEMLNILFVIIIVMMFSDKRKFVWIPILLYIGFYVYKIYQSGNWKKRMRQDYKKRFKVP